jgi:hypothetical protein
MKNSTKAIMGIAALATIAAYSIDKKVSASDFSFRINAATNQSFVSVPAYGETGMCMVSGDFDGDGDLDLIIGAITAGLDKSNASGYFLENDGKGNFSLRTPIKYPQ